MGGGSSSTSETGSAQKWAQPFAKAAAGTVAGVYGQNAPGLQRMTQQVQGMLPGLGQRFNNGSPTVRAAQGHANSVLSGQYMNGNPYLDRVLETTRRNIGDSVGSQFAQAGRYGSGAFTDVLSRNMLEAENSARMGDYNAQMGRMDQMAGMAPALAQADYLGLPEILQTATVGAEIPYAGTTAYANSLGALFNGGTSTEKRNSNLLGDLIGAGAKVGGSMIMASDRRLKRDIAKLDQFEDGLGYYEWQYVWGGQRVRGVMADEVAALRPWALGPVQDGYATVDYAKLGAL